MLINLIMMMMMTILICSFGLEDGVGVEAMRETKKSKGIFCTARMSVYSESII